MGLDTRFDGAFLGPMAENADLLEELVVDAIRDHAYWRRNFHPEDSPSIPEASRYAPERQAIVARTRHVLRRLAADLKHSVPWFSPRYIGHMSTDLLLPGVVARILTTLYNPNNVSEDASGPMVRVELRVGEQLAAMVGYETREGASPRAWGHLTSGGTVANIEALWNHRTARLYPLALAAAVRDLGLATSPEPVLGCPMERAASWALANLTIDDALAVRRRVYTEVHARHGPEVLGALHECAEANSVAALGLVEFLSRHELGTPGIVVPHSAHYSWSRAVKLLGLGRSALYGVDLDAHMRMDARSLCEVLDALERERVPVLSVVGVLGTTEFGTLDPIDAIVGQRDARQGRQGFGVHVDAAWGGYLASMFRTPEGGLVPRDEMRERFEYFPSESVYAAFAALGRTDSMTIDPHKLGFIPYPAGAFVARNREIAALLVESAPYVFEDPSAPAEAQIDFRQLGRFILEGSKPGASAASVFATHEVLPLHSDGFGALIASTIDASETLFDRLGALADRLSDAATLVVPFEPDSNIVCVAVNPAGNAQLDTMNAFMRRLFDTMRFRAAAIPQVHEFVGSVTSVSGDRVEVEARRELAARLGLELGSFDASGARLVVLRHTVMNPWLLRGTPTPIEQYVSFLERTVRRLSGGSPSDA